MRITLRTLRDHDTARLDLATPGCKLEMPRAIWIPDTGVVVATHPPAWRSGRKGRTARWASAVPRSKVRRVRGDGPDEMQGVQGDEGVATCLGTASPGVGGGGVPLYSPFIWVYSSLLFQVGL